MDPMSIGVAVSALLAAKAAEGFAVEAGTRAWDAVQRLADLVRTQLSSHGVRALDQLETGRHDPSAVDILAGEIQTAADTDPTLRTMLEQLVTQAEESKPLAAVIAVARDNARQVNIGGNNSGSISMG